MLTATPRMRTPHGPQTTPHPVKKAIRAAGRTAKWTAEATGIPGTTFSRKLTGHTDWKVGELLLIAHVLGIHPADLLPEEFARDSEAVAA